MLQHMDRCVLLHPNDASPLGFPAPSIPYPIRSPRCVLVTAPCFAVLPLAQVFQQRYGPAAVTRPLADNYRSRQPIINVADKVRSNCR